MPENKMNRHFCECFNFLKENTKMEILKLSTLLLTIKITSINIMFDLVEQ